MTPELFQERLLNEVLKSFIIVPISNQTNNGKAIGRLAVARMITDLLREIANEN